MDTNFRLLLVEDDVILLNVIHLNLQRAGFDVSTAGNGIDGLAILNDQSFDLVVTDCQMPLMSGIEMCEKMSLHPTLSSLPIILCTAKRYEIDREYAKSLGIRHIVGKPFSPRQLVELVAGELAAASTSAT